MCEKVLLGLFLVRFQGSIENGMEIRGSCGRGRCLGHDNSGDYGGTDLSTSEGGNEDCECRTEGEHRLIGVRSLLRKSTSAEGDTRADKVKRTQN